MNPFVYLVGIAALGIIAIIVGALAWTLWKDHKLGNYQGLLFVLGCIVVVMAARHLGYPG